MFVYHMGEFVGSDLAGDTDYAKQTFDITEGDEYTIILVAIGTTTRNLDYGFEFSVD